MVVASEVGVMDFEPGDIKEKGRLQPGKILLVDTEKGEIYYDGELKKQLAEAKPYRTWLSTNRIELDELKSGRKVPHHVENYDCSFALSATPKRISKTDYANGKHRSRTDPFNG